MARRTVAVVWLGQSNTEIPAAKVVEDVKRQHVLVAFVQHEGEHITLHRQLSGRILRTHYSETKPAGKWDDTRVEIAKRLGYRRPARHGKYFTHSPLIRIENVAGYFVGGRRLDVQGVKTGEKYASKKKVVVKADGELPMLDLYLSTADNLREGPASVRTFLGDLVFEMG